MSAKKKRTRQKTLTKQPQQPIKQAIVHQEAFSGPLPPPNTLQHYESILPGAAERIITMAEKQSAHRQDIEKEVIMKNLGQAKRGQSFGLIIGLVAIIGGIICILAGYEIGGSIIGGGGLTGLVSVFVIGKRKSTKELERKAQ